MPEPRVPFRRLLKPVHASLLNADDRLNDGSIGLRLAELLRLRASQINGCVFCIDMHSRCLREQGETEERLATLVAWRESPDFSEREKAALNWTERLTRLSHDDALDADFSWLQEHFDEREIAELTFIAAVINALNRVGISMQVPLPR